MYTCVVPSINETSVLYIHAHTDMRVYIHTQAWKTGWEEMLGKAGLWKRHGCYILELTAAVVTYTGSSQLMPAGKGWAPSSPVSLREVLVAVESC